MCIKRLYHNDNEKKIVMMLDPNTNSPCPQNHSVPVEELLVRDATNSKLTVAPPGDDDHTAYLVMPFLLSINEVPFETVNQVVDLVEQLLEVGAKSVCAIRSIEPHAGSSVYARTRSSSSVCSS